MVIIQRKISEARRIIKVVNPIGRNHKKSARSHTNITESTGTFCGSLTKKTKIKQNKKSGGILNVGVKSIGASDITTKTLPKTIKEAVLSIDLYLGIVCSQALD